jgi:hypothetical protein
MLTLYRRAPTHHTRGGLGLSEMPRMVAVEVGEVEGLALMRRWFDRVMRWRSETGIALLKCSGRGV